MQTPISVAPKTSVMAWIFPKIAIPAAVATSTPPHKGSTEIANRRGDRNTIRKRSTIPSIEITEIAQQLILAYIVLEVVIIELAVGFEDAVGQPYDRVKVALLHEMFFESCLDAFAEQGAVGQDDGGTAAGSEQTHDEGQKEIGSFASLEMFGEVAFDAVFFLAAEWRIGEDDVYAVGLSIADIGSGQGVVVAHE